MKLKLLCFDDIEDILNGDVEPEDDEREFICLFNVGFSDIFHGISIDTNEDYVILQDKEYIAINNDGSKWFKLENWQIDILKGDGKN